MSPEGEDGTEPEGGEEPEGGAEPEHGTDAGARPELDPGASAPPFDYNPSAWSQRLPVAVLAAVATTASVHLGLFQWGVLDSVWDPVFGEGSATVLTSEESEFMYRMIGVPDAMLGAWAYMSEGILALAGSTRRWQFRPWMVLLFGLDVIPLGIVSSVLVVLQGVSVGAWCFLCLVTAAISLGLIWFVWDEVWVTVRYLRRVWREERDWRFLWDTFWGRASERAYAIAGAHAREEALRRRQRDGSDDDGSAGAAAAIGESG